MKELLTILLLIGVILCVNTSCGKQLWEKSFGGNNLILRNVNAAVNHLQYVIVTEMSRGVIGEGSQVATNVYAKVESK